MNPTETPVNFASDNTTGASPAILEAICAANDGATMPYGNDEMTKRAETRIQEIFETDAAVFLVATGSAANSLALSVMTEPHGGVLCHWSSHIYEDECGAPEFFTNGAKLIPITGAAGKLDLDDLTAHAKHGRGDVHMVQPSVVSLTQVTEIGTVYGLDEIDAVSRIAHAHEMAVHMDGARFANALVGLGCTPAEMTWKVGVDALSFGATKNGALAAEAVVFFDRELARQFAFRRKRGGHLFSKMRLLAAQMEAYLRDDLWLANAAHANAMAKRLADGLAATPGVSLSQSVDANLVFPLLPKPVIDGLHDDGFLFYDDRWDEGVVRMVTSFETTAESVDALIAAARRYTPG